uniref:Uncharacterized protein LOC114342859 n=1 Tax=Diabrotica virgifera virgifera TaxID=50390 RepID=A0A6P7GVQ2_DIAVI
MDIRKFLKKVTHPSHESDNTESQNEHLHLTKKLKYEASEDLDIPLPGPSSEERRTYQNQNDLGFFVENTAISDYKKYDLLKNPYVPSAQYNFKNDVGVNAKRCFKRSWLSDYMNGWYILQN